LVPVACASDSDHLVNFVDCISSVLENCCWNETVQKKPLIHDQKGLCAPRAVWTDRAAAKISLEQDLQERRASEPTDRGGSLCVTHSSRRGAAQSDPFSLPLNGSGVVRRALCSDMVAPDGR
jgi:hypothetical protein